MDIVTNTNQFYHMANPSYRLVGSRQMTASKQNPDKGQAEQLKNRCFGRPFGAKRGVLVEKVNACQCQV